MARRFLPLGQTVSLAFGALALGCGAAQPHQAGDENNFDVTPTSSAEPAVKWSNKVSNKQQDDSLSDDQKAQMEIALRRGGVKAAQCLEVAADAKPGKGEVRVTFDGKIGKATDAVVPPPWAGAPLVEACIKRAFVGEYIMPFEGQLEVPYPVELTRKGDAADPKAADPKGKPKDPKKK